MPYARLYTESDLLTRKPLEEKEFNLLKPDGIAQANQFEDQLEERYSK